MWLQAISARICAAIDDRSERPKAGAAIGNPPFQTAILGGENLGKTYTICRNAIREKVIGATIPMSNETKSRWFRLTLAQTTSTALSWKR
jgi:hypothetical protein